MGVGLCKEGEEIKPVVVLDFIKSLFINEMHSNKIRNKSNRPILRRIVEVSIWMKNKLPVDFHFFFTYFLSLLCKF